THADHRAKDKSSAARNARILSRVIEDAPRHYFYLHCELKMLGSKEDARRMGHAALALLDEIRTEERYVVLLNLSELEPDKTLQWLHEATRTHPHRREAFRYLCEKSLMDGDVSAATSYFRMMESLPMPAPLPWTHQGMWYGWG